MDHLQHCITEHSHPGGGVQVDVGVGGGVGPQLLARHRQPRVRARVHHHRARHGAAQHRAPGHIHTCHKFKRNKFSSPHHQIAPLDVGEVQGEGRAEDLEPAVLQPRHGHVLAAHLAAREPHGLAAQVAHVAQVGGHGHTGLLPDAS